MSEFKHLFNPIKISSLEIKNRVFMPLHGMIGLGIGTDQQVGYFEARAKGGAGFMHIASSQVMPSGRVPSDLFLRAYDCEDLPAIEKIFASMHRWGAKTFVPGCLDDGRRQSDAGQCR